MTTDRRAPAPRRAGSLVATLLPATLVTAIGAAAQTPPVPPAGAALALPEVNVTAGLPRGWSPSRGYVPEVSGTGAKTDTPILETPQSVVAVTRAQMAQQAVQDIGAALRYAQGIQAEPYGGMDPRSDYVRARGFQLTPFLDGLRLPSMTYGDQPRIDPWGLERIEVLLGPASTLYGQVPPGGLLNLVSRRPPAVPGGEIQLTTGSHGRLQGGFDIGGPVGGDERFLYRLTGLARDTGTQVDELRESRILLAPSFTWRPTADTSFTVLASYLQDRNGMSQFLPAQGTLLGNPHGRIPTYRFLGEPDFNRADRTQWSLGYAFEHRVDETWTVRQNFRYARVGLNIDTVYALGFQDDLRSVNRAAVGIREHADALGLDNQLQADFATGPLTHRVLFGVDYLRRTDRLRRGIGEASPIDAFAPVYGGAFNPTPPVGLSTNQVQNQLGIYLQDQIRWDRWILTLGGRHDWVDSDTEDRLAGTRTNQDATAFTGRVGLNYVFDVGVSPYVAYATSFDPIVGTTAGGTPFKPSAGEQVEIGVKYQPRGTDLLLTLAAYQINQRNALTADPANPGFNVQTGEARVRGVELSATASLARGLNLAASYSYADSETTRGADAGRQLPLTPRHQAAGWLDQTFLEGPLAGLGLGGGLRFIGARYGDSANTLRLSAVTLVDAAIRYDLGQLADSLRGLSLAVNAQNLFDTRYVATCASLADCYYGNRRLVLASLGYRW